MSEIIRRVPVKQMKNGQIENIEDPLVCESPLTLHFNEEELVTLMCTKDNIEELAVGFLFGEGFLKDREDIKSIQIDLEKGMVWVSGNSSMILKETFLKRYVTTGCGKGTSYYNLKDVLCKPVETVFTVKASILLELMKQAQRNSELFKITGGVHSSAVCDQAEILFFREDIGRHNTIDKLAGRCLLDGISTTDKIILTTGRLSSEIVMKVARMGIPVLASRSAPTDLAVQYAKEMGLTLIGFMRNERMNIYSFPERIED